MKTDFNHHMYNSLMLSIMSEEDSLDNIKDLVAGDITKEIWKIHGKSTGEWAKYAAANNQWYPVTVYRENNPFCYIIISKALVEVWFLDERMFEYVYMAYKKMDPDNMFLSNVYVREYYHLKDKPLPDLKKDINMVFTEEGTLTVTTRDFIREGKLQVIEDNMEAAHPVNVSQNWKQIPKYGEYDDITDYEEIIKPGDLLRDIDTSLKSPGNGNDMEREETAKANKWLPSDWKDRGFN